MLTTRVTHVCRHDNQIMKHHPLHLRNICQHMIVYFYLCHIMIACTENYYFPPHPDLESFRIFISNQNIKVLDRPDYVVREDRLEAIFYGCWSVTHLNFANWNTKIVTSMYMLFKYCYNLEYVNLTGWDTSNVTIMDNVFEGCTKLKRIDGIESFNTSNVRYMTGMFNGCKSLTHLDISRWDTSNVMNMTRMFSGCSKLRILDLSTWNLTNVMFMTQMFEGCESLVVLNMRNIDLNSNNNARIFDKCHLTWRIIDTDRVVGINM